MSSPALVALGRGWTPEEAARYELLVLRGLAADKRAQRLYLRKVQAVEVVRAKARQQQVVTLPGANNKNLDDAASGAGGRSSVSAAQPLGTAAKPRARRRKSEAQHLKSVKKLQHKKLQSRCESAAVKAGGSPPKVLARVLACCGRFRQLLLPEGAEIMWRLRQAEAKAKAAAEDLGLNAMRAAVAAAAAPTQPSPMDEDNSHPHHPNQARIYTIQRSGLLADRGHGARKRNQRSARR